MSPTRRARPSDDVIDVGPDADAPTRGPRGGLPVSTDHEPAENSQTFAALDQIASAVADWAGTSVSAAVDPDLHSVHRTLRDAIPRAWHPFFGHLGPPTPPQVDAIPVVAHGHDVLLCAPTGSGKTEAIVAPLVDGALAHRVVLPDGTVPTALLLVSPTRALCNDLARRLHPTLARLGLSISIRTGDHGATSTEHPPWAMVTTPESLDSVLTRNPTSLRHLHGVFLDEVHIVADTARGDQLAWLVSRLRHLSARDRQRPRPLQICGASASVDDPQGVADALLGTDAVPIRVGPDRMPARPIDLAIRRAVTPEAWAQTIADVYARHPSGKVLVFVNSRADAEQLGQLLQPLGALVHHGSLSTSVRLHVEQRMRIAPRALVIATRTLEIGIDIGDVHEVVLLGAPPDPSAFLQRVGRAARRGQRIPCVAIARDAFDEERLLHQHARALAGHLMGERVPMRPGVMAQQAVSFAMQNPQRWLSLTGLAARQPAGAGLWHEGDLRAVLDQLTVDGWLHAASHERWAADIKTEQAWTYGSLHDHINDADEVEAFDEATGRSLGMVAAKGAAVGDRMALGGKSRHVARISRAGVHLQTNAGTAAAAFLSRGGQRISRPVAQDLARWFGLGATDLPYDRVWNGCRVYHFQGALGGLALQAVYRDLGLTVRDTSPFTLTLAHPQPPDSIGTAGSIQRAIVEAVQSTPRPWLRRLGEGSWGPRAPKDLRIRWVLAALQPATLAADLAQLRCWASPEDARWLVAG